MLSFAREDVKKNGVCELSAEYPDLCYVIDWKGCSSDRFGYIYYTTNPIDEENLIFTILLVFDCLENIEFQDTHIEGSNSICKFDQKTRTVEITLPAESEALLVFKYDKYDEK